MGTFGSFLARPSTTRLLTSMRLEFDAIDDRERRLLVEQIAEPHQQVKAALCGAEVRGGDSQIPQGIHHVGVERVVRHASDSADLSGFHPREFHGEVTSEANVRDL